LAYGRAFSTSQNQAGSAAKSSLDQLQALWKKAPKSVTNHTPSIVSYAKAMARIEGDSAVTTQTFIEHTLKQQWSDELVLEYAHLPLADLSKSFKTSRSLASLCKRQCSLAAHIRPLMRWLRALGQSPRLFASQY